MLEKKLGESQEAILIKPEEAKTKPVLTRRQLEVLGLYIVHGNRPRKISEALGIRRLTLRNHLYHLRHALEARNIFSAVYKGLEMKILDVGSFFSEDELSKLKSNLDTLTAREIEVMHELAASVHYNQFHVSRQAAARLGIKYNTIRNHIGSIQSKLAVRTTGRLALATYVYGTMPKGTLRPRNGLLTPKQYETLEAVAQLDYQTSERLRIEAVLGIKGGAAIMRFYSIYRKLGVHDIFSAVYRAYHRTILPFDEEKIRGLHALKTKLPSLTSFERKILSEIAECALNEGCSRLSYLASIKSYGVSYLRLCFREIRGKLGVHNDAQLAIAAYAYVQATKNQ